jgi:hypothetical protein
MLASSRVIALAEAPEHDQVVAERERGPVRAELELVREVAVLEPVAESLAIGQAAARARVIALAAELVLAIVLAEVREPGTAQVEAVPVRSHLRARLAVLLRTKSVTGPRRHDQVLLLTVEDLAAAVAETTLEPVAAEAVTAWEAAE